MKLPVLTQLNYLSPTSFSEWERCNMLFYLKRLAGHSWPKFPQPMAAAVGSAFDSYIKYHIMKDLNLAHGLTVEDLLNEQVEEQNRSEAIPYGERLFNKYMEWGLYDRFMKRGVASVDFGKTKQVLVDPDSETIDPVALGLPDALLHDGGIGEWKVSGSKSAHGASPTPGYRYRVTEGRVKPPHGKNQYYLDQLKPAWAQQMAIYSWIKTGIFPWREVPVVVEECSILNGNITFTTIDTKISISFQQDLWMRFKRAWANAIEGEIAPADPNKQRCHMWGQVCDVADKCEAYQRWIEPPSDPRLAELLS